MASSFTKKRFRELESVEHTIENVKKCTKIDGLFAFLKSGKSCVKTNKLIVRKICLS